MPSNSSGKWVSRAAATGGGRTYRGQVPANWYMALILIVLVGIGSVVYARSEYRSAAATDTVLPTKNTTWYAAFDFDICGNQRPPVAANDTDTAKQSFYTPGDGVIVINPKNTTDAGTNAILAKFISGYSGMGLTATSVTVPASAPATTSTTTTTTAPATTSTTTTTAPATTSTTTTAPATSTTTTSAATSSYSTHRSDIETASKTTKTSKSKKSKKSTTTPTKATTTTTKAVASTTYTNGETCPKGTKDAGKKGQVTVTYWADAFASKEAPQTVTGFPGTLRFSPNQEITIGFVPAGTKLPKPTGTVVTALLHASTGASVSTTTSSTATSSTTTAPATTSSTTTAPATTSSTTTTAPASTTTSAPAATTTTAAKATTGK